MEIKMTEIKNETPTVLEVPAVKKGMRKITEARFQEAEYTRKTWSIIAEHGTTKEEILAPEYLCNLYMKLRPMDKIEITAEDLSFYMVVMVIESGRGWVRSVTLQYTDLDKNTQEMPEEVAKYKIEWKGPHFKFCAIRLSDKEIIRKEFTTKDEAEKWLDQYRRALAA